jgi:hypothetical protein
MPDMQRQQGQAACEGTLGRAGNLQTSNILGGDGAVGADIDHIDTLDPVVQVLQRPGDDPTGHQGLAQAHLVGDQEAPGRGATAVELAEDVR